MGAPAELVDWKKANVESLRATRFRTSDIKDVRSQPRYVNGQVLINDLPHGTKAYIHSVDGKVVREMETDTSGSVTFNLNDLPKGIYIVSAASTRFKISHK